MQVSPTIQATRSNFLQLHGGRRPAYLEYFLRDGSAAAPAVRTLFDQVQSEQSSRFLGKRNRNVMVLAEGDVEALPSHRWMTIGQVKRLMRYPESGEHGHAHRALVHPVGAVEERTRRRPGGGHGGRPRAWCPR